MVTMLKNKCTVWKKIKFPTFWYNCYYFTCSDTYFIQLETLLINHPSYFFWHNISLITDCARQMYQFKTHCKVTAEVRVQSQVIPCGIYFKKGKLLQFYIGALGLSVVSIMQRGFHAPFLYGRRYIKGATISVVKNTLKLCFLQYLYALCCSVYFFLYGPDFHK